MALGTGVALPAAFPFNLISQRVGSQKAALKTALEQGEVSIQFDFPASGKTSLAVVQAPLMFPFNWISQRVGRVRLRSLTGSGLQTTNRRTPQNLSCSTVETVIATDLKRLPGKASTQVNEKISISAICRGASISVYHIRIIQHNPYSVNFSASEIINFKINVKN